MTNERTSPLASNCFRVASADHAKVAPTKVDSGGFSQPFVHGPVNDDGALLA